MSAYDLNAIEAAAQLADGGRVVAVTAGPADIDDSKLKKGYSRPAAWTSWS